jgi:hypothetical protein
MPLNPQIMESYLSPMLTLYGAKGLVEILADLAERKARANTGAMQAIAAHDAKVLRDALPKLWDVGNRREG